MKKSLFVLAALAAFATLGLSGAAFAAPVALSPSVAASHNAVTAVKATHKKSSHKSSKKSSHKSSKKKAG